MEWTEDAAGVLTATGLRGTYRLWKSSDSAWNCVRPGGEMVVLPNGDEHAAKADADRWDASAGE